MSKKHKTAYNIDKLKICYRQHSGETFGYLAQCFNLNAESSDIISTVDRGDYRLNLADHSSNENEVTAITISVTFEMDGQRHRLGTFDLKKEAKYCFFSFENKALYTPFIYVNGNKKYNCVNFIEFIADDLGLEFNNISTLEIAKDSTRNYVTATQKYIRNYADYEMYENGHIVRDETAIIPNYVKAYSSSRKKMSRQPTLYFRHKEQGGPQLKIYDKRREMAEKEQAKLSYIPQWLDFGADAPIYRAEVTVKNRDIREYMAKIGAVGEEAMSVITSTDKLAEMWQYETDRLLYFRDRTTGEYIHLADL